MDPNEIQKKLTDLEIGKEHARQIQEQMMQIQQKMREIESAKDAIKCLCPAGEKNPESKENTGAAPSSVFIPIGAGVFAEGAVKNASELLVLAGAGVAVKKSRKDAEIYLDGRLSELKKAFAAMDAEFERIRSEIGALSSELQREADKMNGAKNETNA